ncbi:hypothetical protein V8F20_000207 [Naviculisporaceae sp. PSN 640]
MSSTGLPATLDFLTDAGHLLASTAPEISAHLMKQRGNLLLEHEIPQSDVQRQHVCSCCGHIMVPGDGSVLKIEHKKALEKKASRSVKSKSKIITPSSISMATCGPTKVLTCGHCGRFTKINLPAPASISRRKMKKEGWPKAASMETKAPQDSAFSLKVTANANSKKRAKSRKAGLQALLDASQSSRPELGLSLADFRKS